VVCATPCCSRRHGINDKQCQTDGKNHSICCVSNLPSNVAPKSRKISDARHRTAVSGVVRESCNTSDGWKHGVQVILWFSTPFIRAVTISRTSRGCHAPSLRALVLHLMPLRLRFASPSSFSRSHHPCARVVLVATPLSHVCLSLLQPASAQHHTCGFALTRPSNLDKNLVGMKQCAPNKAGKEEGRRGEGERDLMSSDAACNEVHWRGEDKAERVSPNCERL